MNNESGLFEGNGLLFFIGLIVLFGVFNGGFFGGGGNMPSNYATQSDLTNAINTQTIQNQLQGIALSSANNNYETAQLINSQTNAMLQQNNTNLINAIQGFNTVNQNITSTTDNIARAIADLGYHMDQCCCSIKTQMLQDKYDFTRDQLINAQNEAVNANQSQYLLSQLGKFVPTGSGTVTG